MERCCVMPAEATGLAVVVPTRDRPTLLPACLDSLIAAGVSPGDIIVVDSASRERDAVGPAHARGVTVLRCDRPGASVARNVGWRSTDRPLVAFVDDDVRVGVGWAKAITLPFDHPGVVLVTGAVGADGPVRDRSVAVTDDVAGGRFTIDTPGHVGASANVAVRRRVLEAVEGFDELLGAGGRFKAAEDLDLFDRVLGHGYGWHERSAGAVHDQWRNRRELVRLELASGIGFGARLAKLLRTDRGRARRLAGFEVRRLARDLTGDLRRRYKFGVLSRLTWTGGVVSGFVRALMLRVDGGHLAPRRAPAVVART